MSKLYIKWMRKKNSLRLNLSFRRLLFECLIFNGFFIFFYLD